MSVNYIENITKENGVATVQSNITENKAVNTSTVTVRQLLCLPNLEIPPYQRPYKWSTKNVMQLLQDVQAHKNKSVYRLGTVVVYTKDENSPVEIVDGQQRTITLLLVAHALLAQHKQKAYGHNGLLNSIEELNLAKFEPKFSNHITKANIQANYSEIARYIVRMSEEELFYLFEKCQFIKFELNDISEAFQFFDSQNSRGRDLEPHDLLKAYHLREFSLEEEKEQETIVDTWEGMESADISALFAEYLFRIKGWSKGNSSRHFTKNEVHLFKGINLSKHDSYPYTEIIRIAHFYVDRYNESYERNIDRNKTSFPFQLDQTIINGKRFFEMVTHYKKVFDSFVKDVKESNKLDANAVHILNELDTYPARFRTGDQYIRNLFNCAVIYYIDKFGYVEISRAIEKFFIWAYRLRLNHQAVFLASVDNYVVDKSNVFIKIKEAIYPNEVLSFEISVLTEKARSTRTEDIEKLFKELNYYEISDTE